LSGKIDEKLLNNIENGPVLKKDRIWNKFFGNFLSIPSHRIKKTRFPHPFQDEKIAF